MGPVEKALWFIESRYAAAMTLDDIARVSGVTPFHLSRVFATATGSSVMRYLRGRRLSEAARALAAGAPDILSLALEAGYQSHEAFTRAFSQQFGLTPERLRKQRCLDRLDLVEPFRMDEALITDLASPRIEFSGERLIAGFGERYTCQTNEGIPALWQRFGPYIGRVPAQIGTAAYGVCCNGGDNGSFEYIAGVDVSGFDRLGSEFSRVRIPSGTYAVFEHRGHISAIRSTVYTIWNQWLPQSGRDHAGTPDFERYDERFDPHTGAGVVEIWVPLMP